MTATTPIYALPYPAESDTADVPRDVQALAQRLEAVLPNVGLPTGAGIDWYSPNAPPAPFLACDGSAVSRTTYAALFAALGTTWGAGDGSTTFNLPDCRGRVLVGVMAGGNAEVNAIGKNDGTAAASRRVRHAHSMGSLAAGHNLSLPDHGHAVSDPGHSHAAGSLYTSQVLFLGSSLAYEAGPYGMDQNDRGIGGGTAAAGTGIGVGSATSFPGINGGVSLSGAAGVTGGTADGPSFVVANKAIRV